jgi:hypothetical protein
MLRSIICILLLTLASAAPTSGLTLYKCVLLDGSGVIYQDQEPSDAECKVEQKDLDPDANVIPAAEFTGQQEPQAPSGSSSSERSGAPDEPVDEDVLITGEEDELGVGDPGNTPVKEPPTANTGTTAGSAGTAGTGTTATGGVVAPPAPLPPGGILGP